VREEADCFLWVIQQSKVVGCCPGVQYNGFLGHLGPRLPHLVTSVKSLHGFDLSCNKDDVHESKARLISLKFLIA